MILPLVAAALCLALNAFFVLAEFAIVKVRATRLDELARAGVLRAKIAREIVGRLDAYLSVCQLGITIASLGLGWLGEPAFAGMFESLLPSRLPWRAGMSHSLAIALAFCLITFLHILLGELIPKALAIRRTEQAALAVAVWLRFFHGLFLVPMWVLNTCQNALLKLLGLGGSAEADGYTEQELRLILSLSEQRGSMSLVRLLLFENLFDFGRLRVRDAMKPLAKAETIPLGEPWERTAERLKASTRSRFLLTQEGAPRPVGTLHVKDLWRATLAAPGGVPDLRGLARPLPSLREGTLLEVALREFQKARAHLMLVTDEKGRATGILTLEDVLEELVGSIGDEFEQQPSSPLAEIMPLDAVELSLEAWDAEGAIRALAARAARSLPGEVSGDQVFDSAWQREREISTYLGDGVAIPHARLAGLQGSRIVLGRSRAGIPFQAGRPERAQLVFLTVTPKETPMAQIQILARLVGLVQSAYVRERLLEADSAQEVLDIVRSSDPLTHSD